MWTTPLAGQGVFNVDDEGKVTPRVQGIFPETFGQDGEKDVTTADLK